MLSILIGSAIEKYKKAGKTVENATYKCFDSKIRPAYVKLALAHNLVYSPALVSAPRPAIILAKQQKIKMKTEKTVKSIINMCFKKNEAGHVGLAHNLVYSIVQR